mgnify:FL=1
MKWLRRDIHTLFCCYALCLSEDDFLKEVRKLGMKNHSEWVNKGGGARVHHFTQKIGPDMAIVCLTQPPGIHKSQVLSMIVHEAAHIFQWHCDDIGEASPSKEFQAYAMQHITQELFRSYEEQTKKKK